MMGIDQRGWNLPLHYMIQQAKQHQNQELFWEARLVGHDLRYCHMEQLINLESLATRGFKVCIFPLKIVGKSAAPARLVALLDD